MCYNTIYYKLLCCKYKITKSSADYQNFSFVPATNFSPKSGTYPQPKNPNAWCLLFLVPLSVSTASNSTIFNCFSRHFLSIYTPPLNFAPSTINNTLLSYDLPSKVSFSVHYVYDGLNIFCNVKTFGSNGIQGIFLFKLYYVLAWPLLFLISKSIKYGIFPTLLKISSITSILKNSNPLNMSNYYPITSLPHLSKLFVTIVFR